MSFQYFLPATAISEDNGRFDLFFLLAILCKISDTQSEVEIAGVTNRTYPEPARYYREIVFPLEKDAQWTVGDDMCAFTYHP